jgi:hypothetical protein
MMHARQSFYCLDLLLKGDRGSLFRRDKREEMVFQGKKIDEEREGKMKRERMSEKREREREREMKREEKEKG